MMSDKAQKSLVIARVWLQRQDHLRSVRSTLIWWKEEGMEGVPQEVRKKTMSEETTVVVQEGVPGTARCAKT